MWNEPDAKMLAGLPNLYETESIPLKDKIVLMHFFIGGCDWFIVESDGDDLLWGFAILNSDYECAEWGYVSLTELRDLKVGFVEVDFDLHWKPCKADDVDKIREAQGW